MNMHEILIVLLFALPGLILAVVAWVVAARAGRRLKATEAVLDEQKGEIELLRQSIRGLTSGAVGVDRRVQQIEQRERELSERQESYEIQHTDERPYGHAIRLVQQGASAHRLVTELELSESEAELIVRLHGQRDSA